MYLQGTDFLLSWNSSETFSALARLTAVSLESEPQTGFILNLTLVTDEQLRQKHVHLCSKIAL